MRQARGRVSDQDGSQVPRGHRARVPLAEDRHAGADRGRARYRLEPAFRAVGATGREHYRGEAAGAVKGQPDDSFSLSQLQAWAKVSSSARRDWVRAGLLPMAGEVKW